ncbi:unnamed protein product, partial [Nesidiocoris tenuis]
MPLGGLVLPKITLKLGLTAIPGRFHGDKIIKKKEDHVPSVLIGILCPKRHPKN